MDRDITRRDFIHDCSLSALGLMLPAGAFGLEQHVYYPPTRTGLRGSHPRIGHSKPLAEAGSRPTGAPASVDARHPAPAVLSTAA